MNAINTNTKMTRKENLLATAVEIENQTAELQHRQPFAFKSDDHRRNEADRATVAGLEERIRNARKNLDAARMEARKEAFFATEEGRAFITRHEQALAQLKEAFDNAVAHAEQEFRTLMNEQLGEGWAVDFNECRIEIGLASDDDRRFLFGHTFTIRHGYDWVHDRETDEYRREFQISMNYGCLGSFNPETDKERGAFLAGLARFANPETVAQYRPILLLLAHELSQIAKERRAEEKALADPFKE